MKYKEKYEKAKEHYLNSDATLVETCKLFKMSNVPFSNYLKSLGIDIKIKKGRLRDKEKYEEAKNYYINTFENLQVVCKKFKVSPGHFSKYLKAQGVCIENRNNEIIHDYFENINTEEKAYWLGFLFADGNVSKNKNYISLGLNKKDIKHIESFAKCINCNSKIFIDSKNIVRFSVGSSKMKKDLVNKGCVPCKSLILSEPLNLPEHLTKHFIRGYFDGDGCIYYVNSKKDQPGISFVGTKKLLKYISIKLNLEKEPSIKTNCKNTFYINYTGSNARRVLNYLYEESTIHLDRKYEKYKDYMIALQNRNILKEQTNIGENCDVNPEIS